MKTDFSKLIYAPFNFKVVFTELRITRREMVGDEQK